MATKAPCCLGDGSRVLEPIPSIQSEGGCEGRRAPPAPRCPRVTQHPRGCTTPTSRPRSKEPQVHPERQSLGRRRADAKSQPSCRPAVLPHLPAPPGCSAQAPTASGGGQGCPGWEQRQTWGRGGAHGCPELPLLSGAPGRQHAHPPSARQVPALKLDRGPAEDARPQAGAKGWPLPAHQVSRGGAKRKAGPRVVLRDTRWTTGGEQAASAPRSILRATLPPSRNTSASPCAPTVPGRAPDPRRPTQPAHLAWASAQEPRAPTQGRDSANLGLTRVGGAGGWAAGWEDWLLGERWPGGAGWGAPGCDTVTVGAGGRSGSPHAENLPLTRQPRPPPPRQASDLALVQENEVT
ncbi:translation initiation factor IF-2-like [Canis lupus dingo]|uniref:translation initiation factor IF-2-like n=1 Tax=Canis lupus dingo TaxID=286419 RepID=UPI0020C31D19|nr:translation initiation factor IF-2-like [Canis lupus dingo]